jgi:hypothetical protein
MDKTPRCFPNPNLDPHAMFLLRKLDVVVAGVLTHVKRRAELHATCIRSSSITSMSAFNMLKN